MKILDNPQFTRLSGVVSGVHGHVRLSAQLESYSCKMAGADKRLFKQISHEGDVNDLEILSSPCSFEAGSLGRSPAALPSACSRKTLYYLKATLNAAYNPDYDFSNARSEEFRREPALPLVMHSVNSSLFSALGESYSGLSPTLWQAITAEIACDNDADCEIYSYCPDTDSDPFAEDGTLWSFNFFFFNKRLRRIVFFACRATSLFSDAGSHMDGEDESFAVADGDVFAYDEDLEDSGLRED